MQESYLIQRLRKPFKIKNPKTPLEKLAVANPFAFGGGFKNGGLSDEAMNMLCDIFQFDYMGSAEFEFGAVPEALQIIAKGKDNYITFEIPKVKYKYKDWKTRKDLSGTNSIYVICHKDWKEEVVKRIKTKALGDYGKRKDNFHTKEGVFLDSSLAGGPFRHTVGWLELDNGYFFFTDVEMFSKVCALFEIDNVPINLNSRGA